MSLKKKNRFVILIGMPGCGKTTWIKNHLDFFDGYTKVISRDKIRFSLVKPDEAYFSREKEVFKKFISDIESAMDSCNNVLVDATHLNENSRRKLLNSIHRDFKDWNVEAMFIDVPVAVAIKQNEMRAGTRSYVPETAIRNMGAQLTMPTFEEGFDTIYIYNPASTERYRIIKPIGE